MSVIGLLIVQIITWRLTTGQFGGGGGGPSTFGYDGSSACTKPYSRNGRARYEKLPCDFRRQNWCTVAGSAYPWHAVRRFVQENQGLMRRMYGDERHVNILRAELEKNDIELEYDDRYQRYPEQGSRRFQYEDEYEFVNLEKQQRSRTFGRGSSSEAPVSTGDTLDEPSTEKTVKYAETSVVYTRSRTRPVESTTAPNSSTIGNVDSTSTSSSTIVDDGFADDNSDKSTISYSSSDSPIGRDTETMRDPSRIEEKVPISTVPVVALADIARIKNSSINEIPGESAGEKDNDRTELPMFSTEPTTTMKDPSLEDESTTPSIDRVSVEEAADPEPQQQFRPRPEYRPMETKPATPNIEGQLFQDVAAKDQREEEPVLKLRGINACPVKEEVVAPFWANNTRGEVLALLNLYPFEQYVHWEKCTHENKQMYCREGCRCEQQYRLHRLLAYDPNNECRGIFSDWFKFPSCCVCRCYDLPVEFRVTSRSPRIHKQKLKLRPPAQARG